MNDPIVFTNVERSFAGVPVLRGLSLRVREGEIYALLGRNGTGKTTALSILLGFLAPMRGESSILGESSRALRPQTRLRIGLVTEGQCLIGWMTVADSIELERDTRTNFRTSYVRDALVRLGISPSKRISTLSRGQRAQLALVLAMAGDPEVLVLDDPAMGLDAVMRREFLESMIEVLGREGGTVLFSSHIMADVERIADRVGILHAGRLIVDARLDELKRRVQRRFARGVASAEELARRVPALVRSSAHRDGFELVLVDLDAEQEQALNALCPGLSQATTPTLEELFIELTTERTVLANAFFGGAA